MMEYTLREAALQYARRGWHVLALTPHGKTPLVKHGFYDATTEEEKISEWWNRLPLANVGIRTGLASRLVVIDVDGRDAVGTLQKLAQRLGPLPKGPRVRTGRGWHAYFTVDANIRSCKLARGIDVKAEGGYVVAPPSRHPSGAIYTWTTAPNSDAPPPLPRSWLQYLFDRCNRENREITNLQRDPNVTERYREDLNLQRDTDVTERYGGDWVCGASLCNSTAFDGDIRRAIEETLPDGPGQRHRAIFELVRRLKVMPRLADAEGKELLPILREWHRQALPVIRTKPFEESLADFLDAWRRVRFAHGDDPIAAALAKASTGPHPPEADIFDDERLKLLVGLCAHLQTLSGNAPFFLSCRTAAECVGVDHVTAARWLRLLTQSGVLEVVEPGDRVSRRATRYRYKLAQGEHVQRRTGSTPEHQVGRL